MTRLINISGERTPKNEAKLRVWERARPFNEASRAASKEKIPLFNRYRRGVPTEQAQEELVLNCPGEKFNWDNMSLPDDLLRPKPFYVQTIQPDPDPEHWIFAVRRGPRPKTLDEEENKARRQFTRKRNRQLGLLMTSFPDAITDTEKEINTYHETREQAITLLPAFAKPFQDLFIRIELGGEYMADMAKDAPFVDELRRLQPIPFQNIKRYSALYVVQETYARMSNDLTALLSASARDARFAMHQKDQTLLRNNLASKPAQTF